ncbi:MAG: hypothetical protein JXA73_01570 [Acidobacteria bacterium]|nr:hypothetical protein [Acidobacteriota bacterium]
MTVKKESHILLAVHITNRLKKVPPVQKILSQYGDVIRTRLGIHEVGKNYSSPEGVLILDIVDESKARQLQKMLDKLQGIETKLTVFKH